MSAHKYYRTRDVYAACMMSIECRITDMAQNDERLVWAFNCIPTAVVLIVRNGCIRRTMNEKVQANISVQVKNAAF